MRRIGAMIATTALAAIGVVGISGAAHADSTCDEPGTYYCHQDGFPGVGSVEVATTLYSDHHEYMEVRAWSNADHFVAYMDVSTNGGSTWNGWQDQVSNAYGTTYTGWSDPEYDGPGYWVRGCINVNGLSYCTGWH